MLRLSTFIVLLCCYSYSYAAESRLPGFSQLIAKYGAAVVNISTIPYYSSDKLNPSVQAGSKLPLFSNFSKKEENKQPSQGSGFILSQDGYILTSAHVVEDTAEITVTLIDRRQFNAELVGLDRRSDVALLKVDAKNLSPAVIGDPAKLKVGDWVLAIGSPFGFEYSATTGIVSAKNRKLPDESYIPYIQTDAAINPGNSGGPLFNLKGEVVGMNAQIFSRTGGFMGLSFAVPIDLALHISEQLREEGQVRWGWLGCAIQDVTQELAAAFEIDQPRGALITDILPGGPAFRSELKIGDIVIAYEGKEIGKSSELPPLVGRTPPDTRVHLQIIRDSERKEIIVTVDELLAIAPPPPPPRVPMSQGEHALGLVLMELGIAERKQERLTYGVRVKRIAAGPAFSAGVQKGDILLEVDGRRIKSVDGFYRHISLAAKGKPLSLRIRRGQSSLFIALRVPQPAP